MPKESTPSEADVVFNRANVALARSQRLVQSWLPPRTDQEMVVSKTDQEVLKEDEELFKPTPELLGLGACAPDADSDPLLRKRPGANNDRLLEQLLGKKAARGHRASSKPQPAQKTPILPKTGSGQLDADEDDEEGGRATMVASTSASRRKGPTQPSRKAAASTQSTDKVQEAPSDEDDDPRPDKKRSGTYLDQLLAEKASKKRRKQQKT